MIHQLQLLLSQETLAAIEGRLQPLRQEAVSEAVSGWLATVAATVQVGCQLVERRHVMLPSYNHIMLLSTCVPDILAEGFECQ